MPRPENEMTPDYSHLFQDGESEAAGIEERTGKTLQSFFGRIGAVLFGLFFSAIPTVFIILGIGMAARELYRYYAWPTAQATVLSVENTEPTGEEDQPGVKINYAFAADGRRYTGEFEMSDNTVGIDEVRSIQPHQNVEVRYQPGRPDNSTLRREPGVVTLGFALFALPFLVIGGTALIGGLRGNARLPIRTPRASGGSQSQPGTFIAFALFCCVGAFAYMFLAGFLFPWWVDLLIFLAYVGMIMPAGLKKARLYLQERRAKLEAKEHQRKTQSFDDQAISSMDDTDRQDLIAPLAAFDDDDASLLPSPLKHFRNAALITLFVCGIVGAFAAFAFYPFYKSRQAAQFKQADGVVLSSRVKTSTSTDSDGHSSTSYTPIVKYRYTVDGREYVHDEYNFMFISASGSNHAHQVVRDHPKGKAVTVYYNPADPQDAVLNRDISSVNWFVLAVIQPFLLFALGMLIWLPMVPVRNQRIRDFLFSPVALPQSIPFWGVLRNGVGGMSVKRSGVVSRVLYSFIVGYGLVSFAAIFVGAFVIGVDTFAAAHIEKTATYGLMAGGVFAAIALCKRHSTIILDTSARMLQVLSKKRNLQMDFDNIAYWRVRALLPAMTKSRNSNTAYLLEVVGKDEDTVVPVHLFQFNANPLASEDMRQAVVRRTMHVLAEITGSLVKPRILTSSASVDAERADLSHAVSQLRKHRALFTQYTDLT